MNGDPIPGIHNYRLVRQLTTEPHPPKRGLYLLMRQEGMLESKIPF
jgi:hypothetical protein